MASRQAAAQASDGLAAVLTVGTWKIGEAFSGQGGLPSYSASGFLVRGIPQEMEVSQDRIVIRNAMQSEARVQGSLGNWPAAGGTCIV